MAKTQKYSEDQLLEAVVKFSEIVLSSKLNTASSVTLKQVFYSA